MHLTVNEILLCSRQCGNILYTWFHELLTNGPANQTLLFIIILQMRKLRFREGK